jgi:hypothetical protein
MAFSGNECWDIYKFDTNERVGVFLARRSVQHLDFVAVVTIFTKINKLDFLETKIYYVRENGLYILYFY